MKEKKSWYELNHPEAIDSPALLIYKDRVASNIQTMIRIAGDANRLVPHVKTNKMAEVVKMQLQAGITQFKCATIAEAEMLADAGAKNIVLAYQLTQPKALRFLTLIKKCPAVYFASLIDNVESAKMLNDLFQSARTLLVQSARTFMKSIPGSRLPSKSNSAVVDPLLRAAHLFAIRSGAQ